MPPASDGNRRLFSGSVADMIADIRALRAIGVTGLDFDFEQDDAKGVIAGMRRFPGRGSGTCLDYRGHLVTVAEEFCNSMRAFGVALALAAIPVIALGVMAAVHWAAPVPAVTIALLVVAVAFAAAMLWNHNLDRITEAVRRVAADGSSASSAAPPSLTSLGELVREVERLSRRVARRTALVEQLQRADVAIVERLPDPLLVLGADRTVRRSNAAAQAEFGGDLAAALRHPGLRGAIDRAFATGAVQTVELSLPVPVPRQLQATTVPMDPPLADGGKMIVVLSDRTRERAIERTRADLLPMPVTNCGLLWRR